MLGALVRLGLARPDEGPRFTRLTGGVSSDIWRVDLARGPVCVKRALGKLMVEQDWFAPVERNAYEAAWMRRAAAVVPEAVPALLGQDAQTGALAMAYLDPARHQLWKAELHAGRADPEVARAVGDRLVRIHASTADDPEVAANSRPIGSFTTSASSPICWRPRHATPIGRPSCGNWPSEPRRRGAASCTATSARRIS